MMECKIMFDHFRATGSKQDGVIWCGFVWTKGYPTQVFDHHTLYGKKLLCILGYNSSFGQSRVIQLVMFPQKGWFLFPKKGWANPLGLNFSCFKYIPSIQEPYICIVVSCETSATPSGSPGKYNKQSVRHHVLLVGLCNYMYTEIKRIDHRLKGWFL